MAAPEPALGSGMQPPPQQGADPPASSAEKAAWAVPSTAATALDPGVVPAKAAATAAARESVGEVEAQTSTAPADFERGFGFWAVMAALCVSSFQASLENSVVVTAGPSIVADLNMVDNYVWIANAFFVACAAVQPLFGQLCNVFGRRWPMMFVTALFTLGSGICGGATTGTMLIIGRAVQGAGSGGVVMVNQIILADITPLRQRGNYMAINLAAYGVGFALGPFIGGAMTDAVSWRWAFYFNLPFGGVALVLFYLFLHVNYDRESTVMQKLRRIDWVGNVLVMGGTVSMLLALANAGIKYSWGSWNTLVPLLIGIAVLVVFALWEMYAGDWAPDLVMPGHLFRHRTSLIVAINTFLHWALVYWGMYFLPLYFQAVGLATPEKTGVDLLPMALLSVPGSAVAAMIVSRWGRFKAVHIIGESIFTIGLGLFSTQREDTSTAEWVIYQTICSIGGGMVLDTLLPAFQAPLKESDQGSATATWAFIRSVSGVWGVAIPATIFNNRVSQLAYTVSDPKARELLSGGGAYQYASAAFVTAFTPAVQAEIRRVFAEALRLVFLVSVAFGGLAVLLFLVERDVKLRDVLDTQYGLIDRDEEKAKMSKGNSDSDQRTS